jgi:ribose transport system permease protein
MSTSPGPSTSTAGTLEPGTPALTGGPGARPAIGTKVTRILIRYAMLWVLIALVIAAQLIYPGFLNINNLRDMLAQNAAVGVIAVGMTFVIIAGGFDLSVGGIYGLAAVAFARLSNDLPLWADIAVVLLVGLIAGLINGGIVTRMRVNPFVATLGTASLFEGCALIYSDTQPVTVANGFGTPGTGAVLGIPISVAVTVVVFAAGAFLLARTTFGQSVHAVGGNDEAARLAGVRVSLTRTATYAVTGLCAAVGGFLDTSKLGVGQADQGSALPLLSIAIVILGGTSLRGGEGAMWRTVIGLLIMATLTNLFNSLAINTAVQSLVQGAVLIAAVSLDVFARRVRA